MVKDQGFVVDNVDPGDIVQLVPYIEACMLVQRFIGGYFFKSYNLCLVGQTVSLTSFTEGLYFIGEK